MLASLMMFSGCFPVAIKPNESLTKDCQSPVLKGPTNRDSYLLNIEQDKALNECTERMRAIRK